MAPITVAILGATGLVGGHVARACLSSAFHPHDVARVIAFTRDASAPSALTLKTLGVEIQTSAPSAETLKGVDVVVNTLNAHTPVEVKDSYARAAAEAGVKIYWNSEYGFDHYKNPTQAPASLAKRQHAEFARSINGGSLKVISLLTAIFLEWAVGPEFGPGLGIDVKGQIITSIGSPDTRVTFNSLIDVGSTVARISVLAVQDINSVPDRIRISGDARTYNELADIVRKELRGKVILKTVEVADFEKNAEINFFRELRLKFASGEANFAEENDNELVNPGERFWKWKTVPDFVKDTFVS